VYFVREVFPAGSEEFSAINQFVKNFPQEIFNVGKIMSSEERRKLFVVRGEDFVGVGNSVLWWNG
jgi:hypothetical protein